jgi:hypothetical protein
MLIQIFVGIIVGVLFLVFIAAYKKKESFLDRITNKIPVITGFLAVFGIYITYRLFKLQYDNLANDQTLKAIDRSWMLINREIADKNDTCPTLSNSLFFPWQVNNLGKITTKDNTDNWADCNYLSIVIFQSWEDYLTLSALDETGGQVWMANYIQWASSKELKKNWDLLKGNFAELTREFGDFLFKSAAIYKPTNHTEHIEAARKMAESEEFKAIIKKRKGVDGNFLDKI